MEEPIIHIENVHKKFNEEVHALRGVSLDIHKGEVVVVIGPSGFGQIDTAALYQPPREVRQRQDCGGWYPGGHSGEYCSCTHRGRHGLSAIQSVPSPDGIG